MDKIRAIIKDLQEGYIGDDEARIKLEFLTNDEERAQSRHQDSIMSKISLNIDEYQKHHSKSPESIYLEKEKTEELLSLINDTLAALKPNQRFIIYQYIVEGKKQEWIANKLGVSQQAVSQRLDAIGSFIRNRRPELMRRYQELQRGD